MAVSTIDRPPLHAEEGSAVALVELELPAGAPFAPVGRLVVAGVGARTDFPADRIEDLQAALDVVLRSAPAGDKLVLAIRHSPDDLRVEIGPISASYAGGTPAMAYSPGS